jgi:hypothetical protein
MNFDDLDCNEQREYRYVQTSSLRRRFNFDPYTTEGEDFQTLVKAFNEKDPMGPNKYTLRAHYADDSPMGLYMQSYIKRSCSKDIKLNEGTDKERELALGLMIFIKRAYEASSYPGILRTPNSAYGTVSYVSWPGYLMGLTIYVGPYNNPRTLCDTCVRTILTDKVPYDTLPPPLQRKVRSTRLS